MQVKPLPPRVEERLKELRDMKEFDEVECDYCRKTYWGDRDGWHTILINCNNRALARRAA